VIGIQLGLPTDPQTGQLAWQYAKDLQEQYTRVSIALQNARNPPQRPPPIPANIAAQGPAQNALMLQNVAKTYPHIDFSGITTEMITNLPHQRFESRLRLYITERGQAIGSNLNVPPNMPSRTPVPGQVVITNRNPTPVGNDPANNGLMSRQPNMPPFNVEEILRFHEQCLSMWRTKYDTIRKLSSQFYCTWLQYFPALPVCPLPNNILVWKECYRQAMQDMKPLVMGMGLYIYMRRDKQEMVDIIHKVSLAALPSRDELHL
jgi:hypothetical protein